MKHWIQLLAVANSKSSSSVSDRQELTSLRRRIADLERSLYHPQPQRAPEEQKTRTSFPGRSCRSQRTRQRQSTQRQKEQRRSRQRQGTQRQGQSRVRDGLGLEIRRPLGLIRNRQIPPQQSHRSRILLRLPEQTLHKQHLRQDSRLRGLQHCEHLLQRLPVPRESLSNRPR